MNLNKLNNLRQLLTDENHILFWIDTERIMYTFGPELKEDQIKQIIQILQRLIEND